MTNVRDIVREGLTASGRPGEGALAGSRDSSWYDEIPVPLGGGWRVLRFNVVPHAAASFDVAVGPAQVLLLTESPEAFRTLLRVSGTEPASVQEAVAIARAYLDTTRSMAEFFRILDSVGDLIVRPGHDDLDLISILREMITPPIGSQAYGSYSVTAYVQRGDTVESLSVTLGSAGSISEQGRPVATGLRVPYLV